ncbi:hypothetical protein SCLARK_001708 [Spiroplasma clarkii]|nr:hypothetical protein [Spiroplasma clarkii]ARU92166.1 hypothetical protein SCLARK_001708 [Spiroplasma clarkii]
MLLDHVAGNSLFNLLINLIFLTVILAIPNSYNSMLAFWSCALGITCVAVSINATALIKSK